MIIALIISDKFSQLYSGAKTRQLAGLIFKEINDTLSVSPKIDKYFKRTKTYIKCLRTESTFSVVSSEANNSNGLRPQVFLLDEVAVMTDFGLYDALKYGMLSVRSPLAICISTAYTVDDNIFKQMTQNCKDVLDGVIEEDGVENIFSMLFELDEEDLPEWNNFELWYKSSPVQMSFPEGVKTLKQEYAESMRMGGSKISEFQSKMLNMWVDDNGASSFISYDDLRKCCMTSKTCATPIESYDWNDREVYIGLDLSLTTDNTSVAFCTWDVKLQKYVAMTMTFVPDEMIKYKEDLEKVPYSRYIQQKYCISCNRRQVNKTIDYLMVEEYIYEIVEKYNLKVKSVVSDQYNAEATIQSLERNGLTVTIQPQSSIHICKGVKRLHEAILSEEFLYEFNPLFEINVRNAKKNFDRFDNMYIDKKKSTGRIDSLDAVINCFCLFVADELVEQSVYERKDGFLIF